MNEPSDIFDEYLSEFDKTIIFDSESCPVCGVKLSDSIEMTNSPLIELTRIQDKQKALKLCELFNAAFLHFKVYEELDKNNLDSVSYEYIVSVTIKDSDKAKQIIEKEFN